MCHSPINITSVLFKESNFLLKLKEKKYINPEFEMENGICVKILVERKLNLSLLFMMH